MKRLFSQIVAAGVGLWLASMYVPGVAVRVLPDSNFFGVPLTAQWQIFLLLGVVLGLLNFFIRPVLKLISLPIEIITLGFFSIIIDMLMIWILGFAFRELTVPLLWPLFWTTFIIWAINLVLQKVLVKKE